MSENNEKNFFQKTLSRLGRITKFGLVGVSGMVVNMGLLWVFRELFNMSYWFSGLLAIELSIISNFILNDIWTWRDKRRGKRLRDYAYRLLKYNIASTFTAYGINYPVLLGLVYILGINYMLANLTGIALSAVLNFIINHHWTYGATKISDMDTVILHKKGAKIVKILGLVLFGLVFFIFVIGMGIFILPSFQKFLVEKTLEYVDLPFSFAYDKINFKYGKAKVDGLILTFDDFDISADSVWINRPEGIVAHFDSAAVFGLNVAKSKSNKKKKSDNKAEKSGKKDFKLPVTMEHLYVYKANVDLGKVKMSDITLRGVVHKNSLNIDSLGLDFHERGMIRMFSGYVSVPPDLEELSWEAEVILDSTHVESVGKLGLSPITFDFRVWGDSVYLQEVNKLIDNEFLDGGGMVDCYLKGSYEDTLDIDIYTTSHMYGFDFREAKTDLRYVKHEDNVYFNGFNGYINDALIEGDIILNTKGDLSYEFDAKVSGFNLAKLVGEESGLNSDFSGFVSGEGSGSEIDKLRIRIGAALGKGWFFDPDFSFDSAFGAVIVTGDTLFYAPDLEVWRNNNKVTLSGNIAFEGNMLMDAEVDMPNIGGVIDIVDLEEMIGGRGKARINFRGKTENPYMEGTYSADSLFATVLVSDTLFGEFNLANLTEKALGTIDVFTEGYAFELPFDSIKSTIGVNGFKLDIRPAQLWALEEDIAMYAVGKVDLMDKVEDTTRIYLQIDGFRGVYKSQQVMLENQVDMYFEGDSVYTSSAILDLAAGKVEIEKFFVDTMRTSVNGYVANIDLHELIKNIGLDYPIASNVSGVFEFEMPDSLTHATGLCSLVTRDLTIADIPWGWGIAKGKLENGVFDILNLRILKPDEIYYVTGYVLPFEQKPYFDIAVHGEGTQTALFKGLSNQVKDAKALFDIDMFIKGTEDDAKINGDFRIDEGLLELTMLDQPIENIVFSAHMDGKNVRIDSLYGEIDKQTDPRAGLIENAWSWIKGFFVDENEKSYGYFLGNGSINLEDFTNPILNIHVSTTSLPVDLYLQGIFITLNSELDIMGTASNPIIRGDIQIPKGTVVNLDQSSDNSGGSMELPVDLSVTVSVPENFWILTQDAEIEISGDITVETLNSIPVLQGNMTAKSGGKYFVFGQTFDIQRGNVVFETLDDIDPTLDIEALTYISSDSAGVRQSVPIYLSIGGTLSRPELTLSAGEGTEYSHQDLILLLTLNQPLNQDENSGMFQSVGDRTFDIISAYANRQIENMVKTSLGVEQFRITPTGSSAEDVTDMRITVGKYITPKIFLSYSHETATGQNSELGDIHIEYQITPSFKLIGSRDHDNADNRENYKLELDLKWTY